MAIYECYWCEERQPVPDGAVLMQCRACDRESTLKACSHCGVVNPLGVGHKRFVCAYCGETTKVRQRSPYTPWVIGGVTGVMLGLLAYWYANSKDINGTLIGLVVGLVCAVIFALLLRRPT